MAIAVKPESANWAMSGVYSPKRAGALAGVSGYRIGQWARYGLIQPTVFKGLPSNLYSYFDVAEAIAVRWLRAERFSYEAIHRVISNARIENRDWPLLTEGLGIARETAGAKHDRGVIAKLTPAGYVDLTDHPGQLTVTPDFWFDVQDTLRHGGWISRELGLEQIEVVPGRLGGRPTVRGTRFAVQQVALIAADDEGKTILADEYDLAPEAIAECLAWSEKADSLSEPGSESRELEAALDA